jgi:hypothetical protein
MNVFPRMKQAILGFLFVVFWGSMQLVSAQKHSAVLTLYGASKTPKEVLDLWQKGQASDVEINEEGFPILFHAFPTGLQIKNAELTITRWAPLPTPPAHWKPETLNSGSFGLQTWTNRGTMMAAVRAPAVRWNHGQWEHAVEAELNWEQNPQPPQQKSQQSLPASVLSQGKWYRFGVTEDGVYSVSYAQLLNAGILSGTVPSSALKLHGRQGGMEPERNSVSRYRDLPELPMFMEDGGDGQFGPGDRALFYGESPNQWRYTNGTFTFERHLYADTTYYYLTLGTNGLRMPTQNLLTQNPDTITNQGDAFAHYEQETSNLTLSGREWYGEVFSFQNDQTFSLPLYLPVPTSPAKVTVRLAARCVSCSSIFQLRVNNQLLGEANISSVPPCYSCNFFSNGLIQGTTNLSGSQAQVRITRTQPTSGGEDRTGWLDFITLHYRQSLVVGAAGLTFRDASSFGLTEFRLSGASGYRIWDVTTPTTLKVMALQTETGYTWFRANQDTLRRYVAFYESNIKTPTYIGEVKNQDLQSLVSSTPAPDMLIVTHPSLLSAAQSLADFHFEREGLLIHTVTTDQIYHEFSAGRQDPTAIRDFVRTYTEIHPVDHPKYLLLFGDGSYDYKPHLNRLNGFSGSLVPTFQTRESSSRSGNSNPSDYYFVHFSPNNILGIVNYNDPISLAVGRIPAASLSEAQGVVNKIKHYTEDQACLGEWRNWVTLFADDMDATWERQFVDENERVADTLDRVAPVWNVDRVYIDAFVQTSNAGQRYPDAKTYLNNRMNRGTLHMNFIGHGGEQGLTGERVLQIDDIENWDNLNSLSFVTTATCTFTRFDDPAFVSAGERMLLRPDKGSVALLSTTRAITVVPRFQTKLFNGMYGWEAQTTNAQRLGDIQLRARQCPCDGGEQNIVLFGDPAMRLASPMHLVLTDSINGTYTGLGAPAFTDTLRATDIVKLSGRIADRDSVLLSQFNGNLFITVFDKAVTLQTRGNDPGSQPLNYRMQNSVVFRGKVSVVQGKWEVTFKIPLDINYLMGEGKISYYAENGVTDAHGYYRGFQLGGASENCGGDTQGPDISLFLNDDQFSEGGIAHDQPILYAEISDESGVNTAGAAIGHNLLLIIDGDVANAITLNEMYQASLNTYQSGTVRYPLPKLSPGFHEVTLEVWDGCNNLSRKTLTFAVTNDQAHMLSLEAYPNPFRENTTFAFQHNLAGNFLKMELDIQGLDGRKITSMRYEGTPEGFRETRFQWDGKMESGEEVAAGVYVAHVRLTTPQGEVLETATRIIYIR